MLICKYTLTLCDYDRWFYYYNKVILLGKISNPYSIQGTRIIKATTIGNSTVQQNDINWSKRILGKLALAHIKVKIIKLDFIPNIILEDKPHKKLLRLVIIIRSATEWESISDLHWKKYFKTLIQSVFLIQNAILIQSISVYIVISIYTVNQQFSVYTVT